MFVKKRNKVIVSCIMLVQQYWSCCFEPLKSKLIIKVNQNPKKNKKKLNVPYHASHSFEGVHCLLFQDQIESPREPQADLSH